MMNNSTLTTSEALHLIGVIETACDNLEQTAPGIIADLGGKDEVVKGLNIVSLNMGPVPTIPEDIWLKHVGRQQAQYCGNQGLLTLAAGLTEPAQNLSHPGWHWR